MPATTAQHLLPTETRRGFPDRPDPLNGERVNHYMRLYRERVLWPTQGALGGLDGQVTRQLKERKQSLESSTLELNAVLNASYVVWMDSVFHERLTIDGARNGRFYPRPSFLAPWVSADATAAQFAFYMRGYVEHVAGPWIAELDASGEGATVADSDPGAGSLWLAFLRNRVRHVQNPAGFFEAP